MAAKTSYPRYSKLQQQTTSVYHEPTRVKPDHGLDPARLMNNETRAARSLLQGSSLEYIGSWGKARAGSSLNLLIDTRYRLLKGRTAGSQKDSHGSRFHWFWNSWSQEVRSLVGVNLTRVGTIHSLEIPVFWINNRASHRVRENIYFAPYNTKLHADI